MIRITGYASELSVRAGEDIEFFVHSADDLPYRADIVRLIHGDTNPEGPGFKEEEVPTPASGSYPGRAQPIHGGSYLLAEADAGLTRAPAIWLQAFAWPTTPGDGDQAVLSLWNGERSSGVGLFITAAGEAAVWLRHADDVLSVASGRRLLPRVWYLLAAGWNRTTGELVVVQEPVATPTNGGLGPSLLSDEMATPCEMRARVKAAVAKLSPECRLLAGASCQAAHSGRMLRAPLYRAAELEVPVTANHFNGKLARLRIARRLLDREEAHRVAQPFSTLPARLAADLVAAWDFESDLSAAGASATRANDLIGPIPGHLVNMPARGMTGPDWSGRYVSFAETPSEYGGVHFHDDDLDDARWDASFCLQVPSELRSGVYAARLRLEGAGDDDLSAEDYIPFVVRPAAGRATARIGLLLPTATYLAYANDHAQTDGDFAQVLGGKVPSLERGDVFLSEHREYGGSLYSTHSDGSGVCFSSRRRPILNMRPKYRFWAAPGSSSLWAFNSDLHLIDWLDEKGFEYDVFTDEDLHREGEALLARYRVVLTGTHPEYTSERMMDALDRYQHNGGRFIYLGGNGFYWVTCFHPDDPAVIEVRRGEAGTRAWTSNPGEYVNSFDGRFGGLWRLRGRMPSKVCGLTFTAYGFDASGYYRRLPDSWTAECSWIFEGVEHDEFGDYGLLGGGAAGLEIDRYDAAAGTPFHAFVLARSEGHSDLMMQVNEEIHYHVRGYYEGADRNPLVRADLVYYTTPRDGAVFSTGSIAWCGSLSHARYDNDVSRITENVLRRFADDGPLPGATDEAEGKVRALQDYR